MKISEIMTKTPACCLPETSLRDVAKLMVENDCGAIPVVENFETNKPVGIITDRDITVNTLPHGKNALEMTSAEIMSFPAISVKHDANLEECYKTMEDHKVRRMIVVDDAGHCCGIVAQVTSPDCSDEYHWRTRSRCFGIASNRVKYRQIVMKNQI